MLTNNGLVLHAKKALTEKWGYVWGTFGQVLTPALLQEKLQQYPTGVGNHEAFIRANWLNKRTADCVGLIKSYLWWIDNNSFYNPLTDVSADEMFRRATEKGTIYNFPTIDIPGLLVWKEGHIGVYIGMGTVIEARGTLQGVIQSSMLGAGCAGWTHWLKCPFITYESANVSTIQTNLNKLGYGLVVDGVFGPATKAAIKHFQLNNSLIPDGIYRTTTEEAILKMIAKLENAPKKTYVEIIQENSSGQAEAWVKAINAAVVIAKQESDLGVLEIFQHLPALIEKIGNKNKL